MYRNTAGQKITLRVITAATGLPMTGNEAQLTFYVSKDDAEPDVLTNAITEVSAAKAPGDYSCTLTQAETNAVKLRFSGESSTSGVIVIPETIYTSPANFSQLLIDGTGSGSVAANVVLVQNDEDAANGLLGMMSQYLSDVPVNCALVQILDTPLTESASGRIEAAFKNFFNVASPTGTVNSLPAAVPGAANGLHILGDNIGDTTYAAISTGSAMAYYSGNSPAVLYSTSTSGQSAVQYQTNNAPIFKFTDVYLPGAAGNITLPGNLTIAGAVTATNASNDIRGITPKDGAITDASFTLPSSAENTMTGPPTGFMAMVLRIARKMRIIGSKVVRNRSAGTVSIRNNADDANLNVEAHSRSGTVDTISRTV